MSRLGATTTLTSASNGDRYEHHAEREQQQQDVAAHDREEAQQPLDERRVRVGAGDELAGGHAPEVVEVERLQVIVHVVAQVVLDFEGDAAAPIAADVRKGKARRGKADQEEQPRPQRRRPGEDDSVDDLPGDERDRRLADAAEHRGTNGQHDVSPVPEHIAPEAPDPTGRIRGFAQPRSLVVGNSSARESDAISVTRVPSRAALSLRPSTSTG